MLRFAFPSFQVLQKLCKNDMSTAKSSIFSKWKRRGDGEADIADDFPYPDYLIDPNAVLRDDIPSWRYKKAPDYSNTRRVFAERKDSEIY